MHGSRWVFGLFSAFEPNGLPFSSTSPMDASVVQNPPSVKIVAQSSPARGLLRRGFLKPRPSVALRGCSPESAHPQLGQNSSEAFVVVDKGVT
jgi:hypothetical protein